MANSPAISGMYAFGDFRLEAAERKLYRGETSITLTPKNFDLLLFLVESEGRLLRKDDLLSAVWPGAAVEENSLSVAVSALRKALGESDSSRFIETVPKAGYRFVAPVTKLQARVQPVDDRPPPPVPLTPTASPPAFPQMLTGNLRWLLLVAAIAALAILFVTVLQRRTVPKHSAAMPRRLAILPFRNLRGNADDQFLALSLADAVITRLGAIRALTVRPSYDIQKYTTQLGDLPKIAADLAVDAVLTGTFIHEEDNLRIAGQLIDARTRDILWSGGFDLKYSKLLTVQERVSKQIVEGLELTLSPVEAVRLNAAEEIDPQAYEYYLRGIDLYAKNDFQLASRFLEKSLQLAPNYAPAWANLGRAFTASASFGFGGDEVYSKAEAAFRRAIALQPDAIDARVYMANMFTDTGRVEQAVPLLREAVHENPDHAESHWELGYAYRFAGMLEESAAECERARRLDPSVKLNSSTLNTYLYLGLYDRFLESLPKTDDVALIVFYRGLGKYYQQKKQEAIADFDRSFELDSSIPQTRVGKAISLATRQLNSEGEAVLRALEEKITNRGRYDPEAVYKIAQAYAALGNKTSALRVLKRSIETGFFPYPYLLTDPLLESVRREPQFRNSVEVARRRRDAFQAAFFKN